jgi:hypothetical protein
LVVKELALNTNTLILHVSNIRRAAGGRKEGWGFDLVWKREESNALQGPTVRESTLPQTVPLSSNFETVLLQ